MHAQEAGNMDALHGICVAAALQACLHGQLLLAASKADCEVLVCTALTVE
jgi:hypothetical protein